MGLGFNHSSSSKETTYSQGVLGRVTHQTHSAHHNNSHPHIPPPHAHSLLNRVSKQTSNMTYLLTSAAQQAAMQSAYAMGASREQLSKYDTNATLKRESTKPSSKRVSGGDTLLKSGTMKSNKTNQSTSTLDSSGVCARSQVSSGSGQTVRLYDHITESEIKFLAGREECTPGVCVFVTVAILFISISFSSGLYFALQSYNGRTLKERVFKGEFTVTSGVPYNPVFERAGSREFRETADKLASILDRVYNHSQLAALYRRSEVVALERSARQGGDDTVVHFNIHLTPGHRTAHGKLSLTSSNSQGPPYTVGGASSSPPASILFVLDPLNSGVVASQVTQMPTNSTTSSSVLQSFDVDSDGKTTSADLYLILAQELAKSHNTPGHSNLQNGGLFHNYTVDRYSLHIVERIPEGMAAWQSAVDPWDTPTRFPGLIEGYTTEALPPVPVCRPLELPWCAAHLPYNATAYPNLVGHWNLTSLEAEFIAYKQYADFECYGRAAEFICRLLQPPCVGDNQVLWPCREWCEEFTSNCAAWINTVAGSVTTSSPQDQKSHRHNYRETYRNSMGRNTAEGTYREHGANVANLGARIRDQLKCSRFPAHQDKTIRAFRQNVTIQTSYCPRSIVMSNHPSSTSYPTMNPNTN